MRRMHDLSGRNKTWISLLGHDIGTDKKSSTTIKCTVQTSYSMVLHIINADIMWVSFDSPSHERLRELRVRHFNYVGHTHKFLEICLIPLLRNFSYIRSSKQAKY